MPSLFSPGFRQRFVVFHLGFIGKGKPRDGRRVLKGTCHFAKGMISGVVVQWWRMNAARVNWIELVGIQNKQA